jgi:hypothetical protein
VDEKVVKSKVLSKVFGFNVLTIEGESNCDGRQIIIVNHENTFIGCLPSIMMLLIE